jgi:hypothetical protein
MNNIDLSKSMPITCAFSCESNAYRITIRQQAAKIKELEKELSSVVAGLFSEKELEIRDLEQQAKGVTSAIETCEKYDADNLGEEVITVIDLGGYRLGLEYKAKALEDQG